MPSADTPHTVPLIFETFHGLRGRDPGSPASSRPEATQAEDFKCHWTAWLCWDLGGSGDGVHLGPKGAVRIFAESLSGMSKDCFGEL